MSQIREITTGPEGAFAGGFPEIQEAARVHGQNLAEFTQYLQFLEQALMNIGCAAQTIADSYASTDGWSAASLDAVRFAFGVPGAPAPSGFPPVSNLQTWYDAYFAQLGQAGDDQPAQGSQWQKVGESTDPATGTATLTYQDQDGHVKTVVQQQVGNQVITTTTTPKGTEVVTQTGYAYPYGTVTTTTTKAPDGHVTTSTVETYSNGGTTTTTNLDDKGRPTSSTTVTDSPDGGQTVTTKSYDDTGKETTTSAVTYGAENPGVGPHPDDPGADAVQQQRNVISPRHATGG
jgi:hypothetical protein